MTVTTRDLTAALDESMAIAGAMAVVIVDMNSGMAVGKAGDGLDLDLAAAGNSQILRAVIGSMRSLGIREDLEDILITLSSQYHLIRPLGAGKALFLYLVLNKGRANLTLARRSLVRVESALVA
jgi:hypothetical protein